jgi:hypothetical protein
MVEDEIKIKPKVSKASSMISISLCEISSSFLICSSDFMIGALSTRSGVDSAAMTGALSVEAFSRAVSSLCSCLSS